jgi:hypothetical protein
MIWPDLESVEHQPVADPIWVASVRFTLASE